MSKASRVTCVVLILAGVGAVQSTGPTKKKALRRPSVHNPQKVDLLTSEYNSAYALAMKGRYLQAQELYRKAFREAKALGDVPFAGRCLTSLGNTQFSLFQYRAALRTYLEARTFAASAEDWANLASLNLNISALFLQMGDLEAAAQSAEQALADFDRKNYPGGRSRCLIQIAVIRARQGRMEESATLAGEAVNSSYREGDLGAVAQAWDHLGEEYLNRGELSEADAALTEAFRVRKLHHLTELDSSYLNLGRLRLAEGDIKSASRLLDQAVIRQASPGSLMMVWALYHARGKARLAEGRTDAALADFHKALDLSRQWRLEVLPADFTRISSEGELQQIYCSFIDTTNQIYLANGRQELLRESFRAAEENRAASLRALLREPEDWRDKLPGEYWETLVQLHSIESSLLHTDDVALRTRMLQLRSALLLLEAKAGSSVDLASDALLERTQERLPSDAALLSFHLGERQSFLWAVSHDRFRLYRLPRKADLTADIIQFADAVRTGSGSATTLGNALYRELFGQLEASFRGKPHWLLALDEQLFHLPFAALVVDMDKGGPVYLAQRHSIRITTGAAMLAAKHRQGWSEILSGRFLGVGDPIYNTADPRWTKPSVERASFFPGVAYAAVMPSLRRGPVLARLAGSAREVESCARTWDAQSGGALLLEGSKASPAALGEALRASPSVVHIAAHFLQATTIPRYSLIALSLGETGEPQLLSPLEITRSKFKAGVVVLSGCSSGHADALPASGLMGLTRAWLAGGASAVVASHWPTPDDSGSLFIYFYKHLRETPDAGPAVALQGAQRDIVRAGGWRSNPQFWATYFVVGDQ